MKCAAVMMPKKGKEAFKKYDGALFGCFDLVFNKVDICVGYKYVASRFFFRYYRYIYIYI